MASYAELKAQIADLQEQADQARKTELAEAIADIKAKMALYGITLDDLKDAPKKTTTKGVPLKAKYRNPITGKGWAGRGVQPKWLADAVAAGKSKEDFAV